MKYIKMASSFNFGEVVSIVIASILYHFTRNTYSITCWKLTIWPRSTYTTFDNVDKEYLQKPKRFDVKSLKHFMLFMGPLSSCFDLIVFAAMWFIFSVRDVATFQTIWFSYSIVSNLVGMHIIRTAKIPFVQSNAHKWYISLLYFLVL